MPANKYCGVDRCKAYQHRLLYRGKREGDVGNTANKCGSTGSGKESEVYLGVLPVSIVGPKKTPVVNALLDNGSDVTRIKEMIATALRVNGVKAALNISTIAGSTYLDATK